MTPYPARSAALAVALAAAAATAGCETKGQPLPLELARYQLPKVVLQEETRVAPEPAVAAVEPVAFAGREWVPTATEYELPARMVRPVGMSDQGIPLFAFAWDDEPYDRLLYPLAGGTFQEYLEVY